MAEHQEIAHQGIGDSFSGNYYVESAFVKKTVQGKNYTDFMLRDKSGSRNVKFWGVVKDVARGDFVFVSAIVEDYMGNPSIITKNVEKIPVPTDLSDFIPIYDDSDKQAERFDKIRADLKVVEERTNNAMPGMLVDEVYGNSGFFQKFIIVPGSNRPHYGKQGGLLANTVRLADVATMMADFYHLSDDERAILIASALVCRVGAVDAFSFEDCMPKETTRGALVGVGNLTLARVQSAFRRVLTEMEKKGEQPGKDTMLRILHAVASHEGVCVIPMTKEALILNAAWRTDSSVVDAMDFIESDVNETEEFTAWDPAMKRRYYKG